VIGLPVALVVPSLPPVVGGSEASIGRLVCDLASSGVVVHLVAGNDPTIEIRRAVLSQGGSVAVVDGSSPLGAVRWEHHAFTVATAVHEVTTRQRVRIVHAFSHASALAAAIALRGLIDRPVLCATFHEMSTEDTLAGVARSRFIYGLSDIDMHVPVSEHYRRVVVGHAVAPDRVHRVRQGVPTITFEQGHHDRGRRLLQAADGEFLVLCPSRFTPWKGHKELLRAVAKCHRQGIVFRTVLLGSLNSGSASYLFRLKRLRTELGLDERVGLIMDLPHCDMPDALAASDVVVLPSHREGFGLAALEAMAAGVPVIATDVSGFAEYCVDRINCRLIPAHDASTLAQVLGELIADQRQRAELRKHGRQTAAEHPASAQARDLLALYARLDEERPS
jgi:glycosyltransferase involved in cell wall biosynthesis